MYHVRVRQITDPLEYHPLLKNGNIPANIFAEEVAGKKYPPWVYKGDHYSFYGLFQEYMVYKILKSITPTTGSPFEFNWEGETAFDMGLMVAVSDVNNKDIDWRKTISQCYQIAAAHYENIPPPGDLQQAFFGKLATVLRKYFLGHTCEFGKEVGGGIIQGHPDIYIANYYNGDGLILDVKNTHQFYKMRQDTVKQLMAYVALMRETHPASASRYIGVVLPMQNQILLYDLNGWDHRPYLQTLLGRLDRETEMLHMMEAMALFSTVGSHAHKKKTLLESLTSYYSEHDHNVPMQMFLRSPRGTSKVVHDCGDHNAEETTYKRLTFAQTDVDQVRAFITNHHLKYFTHAPYYINLAKPYNALTVTNKETESWSLRVLCDDLHITNAMGGSGVVVHVGKYLELEEEAATQLMISCVRAVLPFATATCPLLIETPAGQGTELLTRFSRMVAFWDSFTAEEKTKLGLCIDTCHVFATGYYPPDYLSSMGEAIGFGMIKLIHMNDSVKDLNSHVDNHAPVGRGCIGQTMLSEVARICNRYRIPMVHE